MYKKVMSIPTHCLNLGSRVTENCPCASLTGIFLNMGVYTPSTLSVCVNTPTRPGLISYLTKNKMAHPYNLPYHFFLTKIFGGEKFR